MKRLIHVEHFENCKAVTLYLVRHDDQPFCEFEKFIDNYRSGNQRDMELILYWLDSIKEKGALERYFRPEGKGTSAIPIETSKLRLYCLRLSDEILILGGGGRKNKRTWQEQPELAGQVLLLQSLTKVIRLEHKNGFAEFTGGAYHIDY